MVDKRHAVRYDLKKNKCSPRRRALYLGVQSAKRSNFYNGFEVTYFNDAIIGGKDITASYTKNV